MSIYTQREYKGLYELTDVARAELIDSKYYNWDLAPTSLAQRTWTTYNVASLWVGMCICLPSYVLAASLVSLGLSTWAAVLNVALGSLILLIPMQLNSHVGTKYGVPYPVFARLSFGPRGAHVASLARAFAGCGWVGIQTWYGGNALHLILMAMVPDYDGNLLTLSFVCFIFWVANLLVAYRGPVWIRKVEAFGAPFLGCLTVALFTWATVMTHQKDVGMMEILNQPMNYAKLNNYSGGLMGVFAAGITSNLAFWSMLALNIPDFSRYAKSQKAQFRGQIYGLPTTMVLFALLGAYVTSATRYLTPDGNVIMDPAEVINLIGNPIAILFGCLGIAIATLTTNIAANILAPANGFSNLYPKKISYRMGVVITCVIALVLIPILRPGVMMHNEYIYIYDWMGSFGIALAPMAGIFIADYYFVKRKNVDVMSLFQGEDGRYWYHRGFNLMAFITWIIACIPPLLVRIDFLSHIALLRVLADNGYIVSFFIALALYPILMKSNTTSVVLDEEMEAMTER